MRSVKPCLYLFCTDDPHSLAVRDTHCQVRTATAVVRLSPSSHAKKPSSAKVAISFIPLLTCIDTSVENSLERDCQTSIHQVNGGELVTCQSNFPTTYNRRNGFPSSEQCLTCSVDWSHIN